MTKVIGGISNSILEDEWDLDFCLKMTKQTLDSSDYEQTISLANKGLKIAKKFSKSIYIKEFEKILSDIEKIQNIDNQIYPNSSEFLKIKGIGSSIAEKLFDAGYSSIKDLANADLDKLSEVKGISINNAQKYVDLAKEIMKNVREAKNIEFNEENEKSQNNNNSTIKDLGEFVIPKEVNKLNGSNNKYSIKQQEIDTNESSIENVTYNSNIQINQGKQISNREFVEICQQLTQNGYYIIKSIKDIAGYDILPIKLIKINKYETIILLFPIRICDFNHSLIISESNVIIEGKEKDQEDLAYKQHEVHLLNDTQKNSYNNLYNNGSLFKFIKKYLNNDFQVEFRTNTDLYFHSELTEYKIFISPIYLCQQQPRCIEKIIPYPYQKTTNIHFISKRDLLNFVDFTEKEHRLIRKYESGKKPKISKETIKSNLINTLQRYSIPFLSLGVLLYLIYPYLVDFTHIIIGLGLGIVLSYSILLVYYYLNYKRELDNLDSSQKSVINQKKADLDEIDIELIAQELNNEEMEQFLYECFGKTHTLNEVILKEEKAIKKNIKNDDKSDYKDKIQKVQIEETISEKSKKDNLVKKYMDFLED